ncbi:hypothetical protein GpartN1_g756.t1 [Galdieria partita]|uniref:Uncharacterized protein n=1 Tax=Galdieria partita TaxID=83374 RepID=A0A9C7UMN6_9RHOD|nr:hypothetical protein GpartN1_g756.t1 [Galdieria partita]
MSESSDEPFYLQSWHHYLEKNRRLAYFLDSLDGKYAVPTKQEREAFIATDPVYGERLNTLQKVKRTGELSAVAGFALGTYYSVKFSKSPLTSLVVCISSAAGFYFLGGTAAEAAFDCYKFDRVETYLQFQKFIRERRSAAS